MGINKQAPFKVLGMRIRKLRVDAKETLLEVSGALEIEDTTLQQIEAGQQLPDEDILDLMISHFNVREQEANKLWELAGYNKKESPLIEDQILKQVMMVIPFDNRVVFSDQAIIHANKKGVTIDFKLLAGNPQAQTVSKVGMSVEQAKALYMQLGAGLHAALQPRVPKQLPPSTKSGKQNSK
jgi:transcriptional regulator with XRE-family HTH domain